ncbi:hypothetical protein Pfo_031327 [Paulownia fortunei]|nr:hypothetical protein Pfo_031327 [Paulownia fortunei]
MDVMFLSFTLSSMIVDLNISGAAAGLISSITNLGMLIGGLFFGILADKYGRVKVFTYTIWIFAIATALMFFARMSIGSMPCVFLAGIGAGGEYGSGMAIIAESFPKRAIAKVTSLSAIGGQVGAILAAILAAVILPMFGWHALYVFGLVPVILIFFIRRHLSESKVFTDMKAKQTSTEYRPGSIAALFATPAQAWQTIALMIMVMVQIAGYFGLMNWLPSIMQKRIGLSASSSSLWMIATIIALAVFVLTMASNKVELLLAQMLVGFFANGMYGGYGAIMGHLYPTEIRATANNTIMNLVVQLADSRVFSSAF